MYAKHCFYLQTLFSLGPSAKEKNAPLARFFHETKSIAGKIYQTKCAAGQIL